MDPQECWFSLRPPLLESHLPFEAQIHLPFWKPPAAANFDSDLLTPLQRTWPFVGPRMLPRYHGSSTPWVISDLCHVRLSPHRQPQRRQTSHLSPLSALPEVLRKQFTSDYTAS